MRMKLEGNASLYKINGAVTVSIYNSVRGIVWIFVADSIRFSVRASVRSSAIGSISPFVFASIKDYFKQK